MPTLTVEDLRYLIELVDADLQYDVMDADAEADYERAYWARARAVRKTLIEMRQHA